jgi:hypothetical protein
LGEARPVRAGPTAQAPLTYRLIRAWRCGALPSSSAQ